jgi:hypothetical protein
MTDEQQHVVASPNPRVEESERTGPVEGKLEATKVEPVAAVKAKPLGKKSKRKAGTAKPRP